MIQWIKEIDWILYAKSCGVLAAVVALSAIVGWLLAKLVIFIFTLAYNILHIHPIVFLVIIFFGISGAIYNSAKIRGSIF